MRKIGFLFILTLALALIIQISLISAIDLTVKEKEISSQAIIELDKPAIFELSINNNEVYDTFEIYSVVGRVDLEPKEPFTIGANETKLITLEAYPRQTPGFFSFEYKIKNSKNEVQDESLAINIVNLQNAFDFYADNIDPESETATVHFDNKGGHNFANIDAEFSCVFFDSSHSFALEPKQKKEFEVTIDKEKAKELLAGPYILNAKIEVSEKEATLSSIIRFVEQSGLDTTEIKEGFFSRRYEVIKDNRGNVPADAQVLIKKNVFTALLTTFNMAPTNQETKGLVTYYIFEKKLAPGESLRVIAKTNWWLLIIVIIGAGFIVYLSKKYLSTKLKLSKRATFVKTKGGEFALKISLVIKARDYIERLRVIDKIPAMVKLYERYGTITPDKVDQKNKRIEWNLESLDAGEERVFSYIIYSKIGVVGKFELPEAKTFYEFKGKLNEITSNKSFFINEPDKKKPQVQKMVDDLF